jgi:S1-C subfamily serine protease
MVATSSGIWGAATVIAHHRDLDLALLYVPRHSGHSSYRQPIASAQDGSRIYVIGHPQGLLYTLSAGIVSREQGSVVQISAPISPGNSGGPVFDELGNLIAVVSSTMDKSVNPNAENLNFAVAAEAMRNTDGWVFTSEGEKYRKDFQLLNESAGH